MTLRETLDTAFALLVDEFHSPLAARAETRKFVTDWLEGKDVGTTDPTQTDPPLPENIDPETWGLDPEAIAAQERMMKIGGAPA